MSRTFTAEEIEATRQRIAREHAAMAEHLARKAAKKRRDQIVRRHAHNEVNSFLAEVADHLGIDAQTRRDLGIPQSRRRT